MSKSILKPAERLAESWMSVLQEQLHPPCVVVSMGNFLKGDDAVGPEVTRLMKDQCRFEMIEAGCAPENILDEICRRKPSTVLFIDAAEFAASPGAIRVFNPDELAEVDISTHSISPQLMMSYLQSSIDAKLFLVGIKPGHLSFDRELSAECQAAAEQIAKFLIDLSLQQEKS